MNIIYVADKVLQWEAIPQTSSINPEDSRHKCYGYWQHAEKLLVYENEKNHLIDCIANLNRTIDQRLKTLSRLYNFKKLPFIGRSNDLLKLLGELGIARPYMLKKINSLRNAMEHQYTDPPTADRCRELLELVWYFLRSTDMLVNYVQDDILLSSTDDSGAEYWMEVRFSPKFAWLCSMRGLLPTDFIINGPASTTFELEVDSPKPAIERHERESMESTPDFYFSGSVNLSEEQVKALAKIYFSVL